MRIVAGCGLIAVVAYGWVAAASFSYCWGRDILNLYTFPWTQWITAAPWYAYSPSVLLWLILSAIPPTLFLALLVLVWVRNRPRQMPKVYGEAKWADRAGMAGGGITSSRRV